MPTENDDLIKVRIPAGFIVKIAGIPVQLWESVTVTMARGNLHLMPELSRRADLVTGTLDEMPPNEKPAVRLGSSLRWCVRYRWYQRASVWVLGIFTAALFCWFVVVMVDWFRGR